jgi:hypothetical protein
MAHDGIQMPCLTRSISHSNNSLHLFYSRGAGTEVNYELPVLFNFVFISLRIEAGARAA